MLWRIDDLVLVAITERAFGGGWTSSYALVHADAQRGDLVASEMLRGFACEDDALRLAIGRGVRRARRENSQPWFSSHAEVAVCLPMPPRCRAG